VRNFTIGVLVTLAVIFLGGLAAAGLGLIDTTFGGRARPYRSLHCLGSAGCSGR
jgi:hypothetical protein